MIASVGAVGFCFGEDRDLGSSSVEARRRFFDCCGAAALEGVLETSSGEVGESGAQLDDAGDEGTLYEGLGNAERRGGGGGGGGGGAGVADDAIDPKAGGGSVNASSREDRLGGGFGGRSTEDWGVGGRIGRGIVRVITVA